MISSLFLGRDAFIDYTVSVTGMVLIIPSLLWLFFSIQRQNKQTIIYNKNHEDLCAEITSGILFLFSFILLCFLIAPGTSYIINRIINPYPYINTMITIPIALISVYAFLSITTRFHITKQKRYITTICFIILIVISSSIPISYNHSLEFDIVSNSTKISPEVQEICDIIGSDYAFLPEEVFGQIGEFDSGVHAYTFSAPFDRSYANSIAESAQNAHALSLVIAKAYDHPKTMSSYGYKRTNSTKHYFIYQLDK